MSDINTLADVVRVNGAGLPDKIALVQAGRDSVTWAQLLQRSARTAQALADAGVGAGDRVAFLDKNSIEHFDVSFGAAMLNAVSVDVNWRLAAPEVQYIVDDAGATVLIVGPDFVPVLDAIVDQLPKVTKFVVIGGHPDHEDYDEWMARYPADDPGAQAAAGDVAFQLYSSGTTGRPKGVMLSNHNLFALLPMARDMWGIQRDSVNLVAMPLFHIGGGGWAVAGMYEGATSVIVRDIDPAALIRTIESERITHAFLVPAAFQFMLMVPGVEDADFSSLETIVYGASPISEEVLAKCVDTFKCKFWQAYGLTETTGAVVNLAPEDHDTTGPNRHRLRSCGLPGPGVELRIVGETRRVCRPRGRARSGSARHRTRSATGTCPRRPRRRSPRTAGSSRATPAISTRTGTCTSTTG